MTRTTLRDALTRALSDAMAADPTVIVLGEDVGGGAGAAHPGTAGGAFGATKGLYRRFGARRVIDTPITEAALLGVAAGAAATGLKPVVDLMFADFAFAGADPIVNFMAQAGALFGDAPGQGGHMPLVVRAAFGAGDRSGAQHSQCLHGLLAQWPAWRVYLPTTPADAYGLLSDAIAQPGPVAVLEHKLLYDAEGTLAPAPGPGTARILRSGSALTLVATAAMVPVAASAAKHLATAGHAVEVIDLRTLAPLDMDTVTASVAKTGRLLVVEEDRLAADHIITALVETGFGSLTAPPVRLTPPRAPVPFAPALEDHWLPSAAGVAERARRLILRDY